MKPALGKCSVVPLLDGSPAERIGKQLGLVGTEWRCELGAWGTGTIEAHVAIEASATGDLCTPVTPLKDIGVDRAVTTKEVRLVNAAHYRAVIAGTVGEVTRVRVIASRSFTASEIALAEIEDRDGKLSDEVATYYRNMRAAVDDYQRRTEAFLAENKQAIAEEMAQRERHREAAQREHEEFIAINRLVIAQREQLLAAYRADTLRNPQ